MTLLLDIGNTRVKWATFKGGEFLRHGAWVYGAAELGAELTTQLGALPQPEAVLAVTVAGDAIRGCVSDWAHALWRITPSWLQAEASAVGVHNGYRNAAQLGADRWAALLGAHARGLGPVCVVDAGTAITIDVLSADGVHEGGVIVPGLTLMERSLVTGTAGVLLDGADCDDSLGHDTASGVLLGSIDAACGAVIRIRGRVGRRGDGGLSCVFTGGDGERLWRSCGTENDIYEPYLVFHGLLAWASAGI